MSDSSTSIEEVIEDFLRERRSGSRVDARSFAERHPEHGPQLVDALESAELLESAHAERDGGEIAIPERFGEFRVIERLGGGGMGIVFRAHQESLGRDVALKLIRPEHLYFDNARERFRRETEAAARLQHPGLVPIYTVGEAQGMPFYAMELVSGATLAQALHELRAQIPEHLRGEDLARALQRSTPACSRWDASAASTAFAGSYVDVAVRLVIQVADALQHAHSRGVLHRDVKPSNIAVTHDGRALLFDFGLATLSDSNQRLTLTRGEVGSLSYMSPEQLRGPREAIDRRSDVYCLGVTLYELLALQLPFVGNDPIETRGAILDGGARPLRSRNPAVPRDLETVCAKAMERDAGRRYADAAAFARDLRNVLEHRPIDATPAGAALLARRWVQRHPIATTVLAAAIALPSALLWQQVAHAHELDKALADTQRERETARDALGVAERERESARIEARDSREINDFLIGLFRSVDPADAHGREVTAREMLDEAAQRMRTDLLDQPVVRARLLSAIGESYSGLGAWEAADELLRSALELQEKNGESVALAGTLASIAALDRQLGRPTAIEHAQRAVQILKKLQHEPTFDLAETLSSYALCLEDAKRIDEAESAYRESLAVLEQLPPPQLSARAAVYANLANLQLDRQELDDALESARTAVELQREFDPAPHPAMTSGLNAMALALGGLGRFDEARKAYDETLALEAQLTGEQSVRYAAFLTSKSYIERRTEHYADELALLERASALFALVATPTHENAMLCRDKLAAAYQRAARWKDARKTLEALMPAIESVEGRDSARALGNHVRIARCCEALGDWEAAEHELTDPLAAARDAGKGDDDAWEALASGNLARYLAHRGELAEAKEWAQHARELASDTQPTTAVAAWTAIAVADVAQHAGELDRARAELEPLARLDQGPQGAEWTAAIARARLAALLAVSEPDRSKELATSAREELERVLGADHPETRAAAQLLASAH